MYCVCIQRGTPRISLRLLGSPVAICYKLLYYTLSRKKEKRNREEEKSQGSTNYFMPQFLYGHAE